MEAGCHFGGVRGKGAALRAGRYSCSMVVSPTAPLRSFDFAQDRQLRSDIYGAKASPRQTAVGDIGGIDRREGKRSHSCAKAAHEWGTQIYERATRRRPP